MAYESRAKRLDDIMNDLGGAIENATSEARDRVQELYDEIENWKSNMEGTNLEATDKYNQLSDCLDELDALMGEIDDLSSSVPSADVTFPGMY